MLNFLQKVPVKCFIYSAYAVVWAGVLGSLYFSQFMNLPPCSLCIIQRGLMYPLVLILTVGIWKKDRWIHYYALPFSILGLVVATYHNLLVWHIAPADLVVCSIQLPCTIQEFALFGFITIPLMSFAGFFLITASLVLHLKKIQMLKEEHLPAGIR